jgi:riboflavin kinase/FMN adenylyltransferase
MRVIRDIGHLSADARGATFVLGSFDGVHRGHATLVATAHGRPYPVGILTFSPHPRLLVQPAQPPFLLTLGEEKHDALRALGVDLCVELPFTREFASISAEDFVIHILVEHLAARHLVFGDNFRFGAGRKGDAALLQELGAAYGFTVDRVVPVLDESGRAYSSTRVREHLRDGDVAGAHAILGRPWTIKVVIETEPATNGRAATFRFGGRLKPAPGYYSVKLRSDDRGHGDAHLIVSQDNDVGHLQIDANVDLRGMDYVALEFVDFVGPLTIERSRGAVRTADVCHS